MKDDSDEQIRYLDGIQDYVRLESKYMNVIQYLASKAGTMLIYLGFLLVGGSALSAWFMKNDAYLAILSSTIVSFSLFAVASIVGVILFVLVMGLSDYDRSSGGLVYIEAKRAKFSAGIVATIASTAMFVITVILSICSFMI